MISKVGSKESEQAGKDVVKKLLAKKSTVYTISPIEVEGGKKIETLDELKKINIKYMTKDFEKNEKILIASYRRDKRKKFHMSKRKGRVDLRTNKPGKRK